MFFFYLYLAHLLSDYLLQPRQMVEWKHRSHWGVFTHSLVHFLVTTLLVYLYTDSLIGLGFGLIMGVSHFLIDYFKIVHDNKHHHTLLAYWLDQLAHFLVIFGLTLLTYRFSPGLINKAINWDNSFNILYFNPIFITYSCLAIFSTLTIEYSYLRVKQQKHQKNVGLSARHMLKRLFLFTLVYIGLLFSLVPSVGFNF